MSSLESHLRRLRLGSMLATYDATARRAQSDGWSFTRFLEELCETEVADREQRRLLRNLKASRLPTEKTFDTLDLNLFSKKVQRQIAALRGGGFVERGDNVLCFGLPGRGKTHLCCALGHALIEQGHRVLFMPAFRLVQRLLMAKRDLCLDGELKKLDAFDAVIIDDIGYVQQDQAEMEVLFTFLAERYERKSVLITSNLVFSQWDRIFKDPMTTMAAIDRLVHHADIIELKGKSVRGSAAQQRTEKAAEAA